MAIINCTIGQNQSKYSVYIEYSYTQDKSTNTTTVEAALNLKQLTDAYDFDTTVDTEVSFTMNGQPYTKTGRININDKGNAGDVFTLVSSGKVKIPHNTDGTGKLTFSCNNTHYALASAGYGPGNIKLSSTTITLPTIPRAASLDKITNASGTTISSIAAGNSIKLYYTPKSTEYYHKVFCYVGSSKKYESDTKKFDSLSQQAHSVSVNPEWFSSSTSGTLTCKIYTYSDSACTTKVGNQNKDITVTIPDNLKPSPSLTVSLTPEHNLNEDVYLQGISSATIKASATPGTGAKLTSLILTGESIYESSSGADITKTFKLDAAGSVSYTVTAIDSRQRKASVSKSVTILPYTAPTYAAPSITRCDSKGSPAANGGYALLQLQCAVQSIKPNTNELNPYTVSVKYRAEGTDAWTDFTSKTGIAPSTVAVSLTNNTKPLSEDLTYKFKITITDSLGNSVTTNELIVRGDQRPINISQHNNGVAIGGLSTANDTNANASGLFEVFWPTVIDDEIIFRNTGKTCTMNSPFVTNGSCTINQGITINNGTTISGNASVGNSLQVGGQMSAGSITTTGTAVVDGALTAGSITTGTITFSSDAAKKATLGDTGWQSLSLANNFTNQNDNFPLQYRKINDVVYIRGTVKRSATPTSTTSITTLPASIKPSVNRHFFATCTGYKVGRVIVNTDSKLALEWVYSIKHEDTTHSVNSENKIIGGSGLFSGDLTWMDIDISYVL